MTRDTLLSLYPELPEYVIASEIEPFEARAESEDRDDRGLGGCSKQGIVRLPLAPVTRVFLAERRPASRPASGSGVLFGCSRRTLSNFSPDAAF
jgi:hypothetical protein